MKIISLGCFPFALFRAADALHVESPALFKLYIDEGKSQKSEELQAGLNALCAQEKDTEKSVWEDFKEFKKLQIRPWSFNSLIKENDFFTNSWKMLKFGVLNLVHSQKDSLIENQTPEPRDFPVPRQSLMKQSQVWQSLPPTLLEKAKSQFVFYDEYDFAAVLLACALSRRVFRVMRQKITRS